MKQFSTRFEDLQAHSIVRNLRRMEDNSPDHQLAAEFKDHIRRTERYLACLEDLLRSTRPVHKAAA